MKPHVFVLLALLAMLCVPVTAWTNLATQDYNGAETNVQTFPGVIVQKSSYPLWNQTSQILTRITVEDAIMDRINTNVPISGSIPWAAMGPPSYSNWIASGTLTWSMENATLNTKMNGDIEILIDTWYPANITATPSELNPLCYFGGSWGQCPSKMSGTRIWYYTNSFSDILLAPLTGGTTTNANHGIMSTWSGSAVVAPVAGFSCVPTSQFPSTDVVCTDTSTNTPTDWYWSIDAEAMGIKGWQTSTSQNFTWQSAYSGLYTVNLRANNSAGSDWENKTNYVSISANATPNNCNLPKAAGYSRTVFECLDSQTSSAVSGCDIQLRDNEANAWSNATNRQDGLWCIDTLPSHTINGYGQATGYTSTSSLNLHALDLSEGMYYLLMIPGYVPAAPDGNVYLYVTVNDYDNSKMIPSAYVTASWSGGGYTAATTSATGTAILTVKNSTSVYITATKSGYVSVNRVITTTPFGPDSTTIGLHQMTVQPTATATTGPGGTVAPTVNPYGTTLPSGVMPAGYTNNQGQIMLDFLAANGLSLVQLCFLVTILALLGVKLGK